MGTTPAVANAKPFAAEGTVKLLALLIALVGVVLTLWLRPAATPFWEFTKDDIVRLFTQMIVIALVIERSLEVLLTPWRAGDGERLKNELKNAHAAVKKGDPSAA